MCLCHFVQILARGDLVVTTCPGLACSLRPHGGLPLHSACCTTVKRATPELTRSHVVLQATNT
jgi:hypothetical protein